jgi:large subunit ribosomal protein L31
LRSSLTGGIIQGSRNQKKAIRKADKSTGAMKPNIHPDYYEIDARCACGNVFKTGSTSKEIKVDICSACHPFYTGKQKFVDAAGRVERFQKKFGGQYFGVKKGAAPAKS